ANSYCYAHYAVAQKACDMGDVRTAKKYLAPIIDAEQLDYGIKSSVTGDRMLLRVGAFDLIVRINLAIAESKKESNTGKDIARSKHYMRKAKEYLSRALAEYPDDPILLRLADEIENNGSSEVPAN
ncbi:MAG: hypothetical protein ABIH22_02865, partial [Candidatus Margulisiibacteriota bacterium]